MIVDRTIRVRVRTMLGWRRSRPTTFSRCATLSTRRRTRTDSCGMTVIEVSDARLPRALLELDGRTLTIRDVRDVARRARTVRISARALEGIDASRELKRRLIDHERPIYGVTTGFGD